MNTLELEKDFKEKVCSEISLYSEGKNRFKVFTPFQFDNGDHLSIALVNSEKGWILTDEGNTFMRLSESMDVNFLEKGKRSEILNQILKTYSIIDYEGELVSEIEKGQYGNSLFSFIQGLVQISDLNFLKRDTVKSTFYEDLKIYFSTKLQGYQLINDYYNERNDPEGKYKVDFFIQNGKKPFLVYGISTDDKCRDAMISLLQFEKWKIDFHSLAIFESQEKISRNVLAKFSDICEKQYSGLYSNQERIEKYLRDNL